MSEKKIETGNWELAQYLEYFAEHTKLVEDDSILEMISETAATLSEKETKPISPDMMRERSKDLSSLISAIQEFAEENPPVKKDDKKEMREVLESLSVYCKKEKELAERPNSIRYFKGKSINDLRKGVDYQEILSLERRIDALEKLEVNEQNFIQYTNAVSDYVLAAKGLMESNPDRDMSKGRMKYCKEAIIERYEPFLDSARDMRSVRELLADKKLVKENGWNIFTCLKTTAHHTISGELEVFGAESSQRIKTTVNGVEGFFTREFRDKNLRETVDHYLRENTDEKAKLIQENKRFLTSYSVDQNFNQVNNPKQMAFHDLCSRWNQMPVDAPNESERKKLFYKKENFKTFLAEIGKDNCQIFNQIFSDYDKKLSQQSPDPALSDEEWKKKVFTDVIVNLAEDKKKPLNLSLAYRCIEYSDIMIQCMEDGKIEKDYSVEQKRLMRLDIDIYQSIFKMDRGIMDMDEYEAIEARKNLLSHEAAKKDYLTLHGLAHGMETTQGLGGLNFDDDPELSGRNVVTSRFAELLNVGSLIAHAEPMTMDINGKTIKGCFMEMAKGISCGETKKLNELKELNKLNPNRMNAEFMKDALTLNLFDVICAQRDRHGKNYFMTLGEDAGGNTIITGLQGIDNDQAFSRHSIHGLKGMVENGQSQGLQDIKLIDAAFANRLMEIGREEIEYIASDILSPHEIDGFVDRLETVQKWIKDGKFIRLEGEQWDLDQYLHSENEKDAPLKAVAQSFQYQEDQMYTKGNRERYAVHSSVHSFHVEWHRVEARLEKAEIAEKQRVEESMKFEEVLESQKQELKTKVETQNVDQAVKDDEKALREKRAAIFERIAANAEHTKSSTEEPSVSTDKKVVTYNVSQLERDEKEARGNAYAKKIAEANSSVRSKENTVQKDEEAPQKKTFGMPGFGKKK